MLEAAQEKVRHVRGRVMVGTKGKGVMAKLTNKKQPLKFINHHHHHHNNFNDFIKCTLGKDPHRRQCPACVRCLLMKLTMVDSGEILVR